MVVIAGGVGFSEPTPADHSAICSAEIGSAWPLAGEPTCLWPGQTALPLKQAEVFL